MPDAPPLTQLPIGAVVATGPGSTGFAETEAHLVGTTPPTLQPEASH